MENSLQTVDVREKKRLLNEFVKDMAELESEEYKARQIAKKCFEELEELQKERELKALEEGLKEKKDLMADPKKHRPRLDFDSLMILFFSIFWIIVFFPIGIAFILASASSLKEHRQLKKIYRKKLEEYPRLIPQEEQKIIELKKEIKRRTAVLQKHGEEYLQYADKLAKEKGNLYSLDIIPPDYRYMKCVMILDYVFRNDLADDMRGAVLYYEDRCYKQIVEEGFDRIVYAIEDLNAEMRHLHRRLEHLDQQAKEIFDGIAMGNALQAATLAENYAAHQKMEYYAEQYRKGLL